MTGLHSGKILKTSQCHFHPSFIHTCVFWNLNDLLSSAKQKNRSFMECSSCSFLNAKSMVTSKIFNLNFSLSLTQTIIWLKKTWHVVHKLHFYGIFGPFWSFFIPMMAKLNLQFLVSHDPSETILINKFFKITVFIWNRNLLLHYKYLYKTFEQFDVSLLNNNINFLQNLFF